MSTKLPILYTTQLIHEKYNYCIYSSEFFFTLRMHQTGGGKYGGGHPRNQTS